MLGLLAVVLAGSALVLLRLSSGASVDLSKLNMQILNLQSNRHEPESGGGETAAATQEDTPPVFPEKGRTARSTPAEGEGDPSPGAEEPEKPAAAAPAPAGGEAEGNPQEGSFTLTVAGTVCMEGEILKNAWNTDSKTYDAADTMMLLKPELRGDVNAVFVENIITDGAKANDTVAPEALADLLQEAGFRLAACGYSKAYDKGSEGIDATWMALDERGIIPTGIRAEEKQGKPEILTVNGVRTAFLQYTGTVPAKTRKKMEKAGTAGTVPEAEAELIQKEIGEARAQGAEAVIVLLKWGKTDSKPDSSQRELAAAIAKAGADLIIGSGSRIPQGAEYLDGPEGTKVLCTWSLGSLLTGDRSNPRHLAGYLLHVTVKQNGKGGADILAPEYSPVYTWKYKQDGRYYYRCLASDQPAPDGMDTEQQKTMEKAEAAVSEALEGSPLSRRTR